MSWELWIISPLVGEYTIRLGSIWGSKVVPYNSDQYYQLSTENWRGIICTFSQFYLCSFLLWTLNYLESQISILGETVCLCLCTPSMYVLDSISRVGTIVELTLLAPLPPTPTPGIHSLLPDVWCKKILFHLFCLFWSCLRQEDKCVLCSSMSTKMEVPLQSELTECLVNVRHWLLCMGADLIGDMCWGLKEPQSCWRNMPITNSIFYRVYSIQSSHSVMSDSLQPQGLQHARPPCPSPTPEACSNSCPSSQWCHPTISSSVVLFSSCLQSFPATQSFLMSLFSTTVGQIMGISGSDSVLPMNIQDWFPLALTSWIFLQSKGLSRVLSNTTVQNH